MTAVKLPGREPQEPAPPLRPFSLVETVYADYRHLGLSLTAHPMSLMRNHPSLNGTATTAEVEAATHNTPLTAAAMVQSRQRPATARGVVFLTIEVHLTGPTATPKEPPQQHPIQ